MSATNDGGAFPQSGERFIAIVGEHWGEMLGQDRAKHLTPKVGIFLHGENSDLRSAVSRMQVISGNVELAMFPLQQIMDALIHRTKDAAKFNKAHKDALTSLELALEHIKRADAMLLARSKNATP